jgi:hypothetical protein
MAALKTLASGLLMLIISRQFIIMCRVSRLWYSGQDLWVESPTPSVLGEVRSGVGYENVGEELAVEIGTTELFEGFFI